MAVDGITEIYTQEQIAFYAGRLHAGVDAGGCPGVAYFAQKGADGLIKIGYTKDVKNRLRALKVSHGKECRLLATRDGGADRETAYHFQFAAHRIEGEWFAAHPDILAEIDRIKKG